MPPPDRAPDVGLTADLRFEVVDATGTTTGHLTGSDGNLVLDVSDASVLARQLPVGQGWSVVSGGTVPQAFRGQTVTVVSQGRDLGRIRTTASGRVRIRPTPAGVRQATVAVGRERGAALLVPVVVAVVLAVVSSRRRRAARRPATEDRGRPNG